MSTITSVCRAVRWSLVPFSDGPFRFVDVHESGGSVTMFEAILAACDPAALLFDSLAENIGAVSWLPAIISVENILNEGCAVARILVHGGHATFLGYSSTPTYCQRSPRTRLCLIRSGPRIQACHCLLQSLRIQLLGLDDTMDAVIRSLTASCVQWV